MQGVMALASATVRDDTPEDAVTIDARGLHYRALNEQIAADRYLASKKAARSRGLGIRMSKLVPPGSA